MTSFRLCDNDKCDSVLFFDAILFLTRLPCSKGMWARLWYARIKSCNSNTGFGSNIGSERSRNSFKWEKKSKSKKQAYETASEEDSVLASEGSATAIKRKKVPSQKFLPAYHEAYPCLVPSRKGSELVLCTTCKSDFHGGLFDCVSNLLRESPTRSSKRLESFFQLQVCLFLPFPRPSPSLSRFNAANI